MLRVLVGMWICAVLGNGVASAQTPLKVAASAASAHVGETVLLCGIVAQTYCSVDRGTRLTLATPPGSPPVFVRIAMEHRAKFGPRPEDRLYQQLVCVTGKIEKRRVAATINLTDAAALTVDAGSTPSKPFAPGAFELCDVPTATKPRVLREQKPEYPKKLRASGLSGQVWLQGVVETTGKVGAIRVTQSLHADLDAQAEKALRQWVFAPAMLDGKAVPVVVTVQMAFALRR